MTLETANRLVEYRKKHNLSQEDVAEKIGVSRQAVSKWERVEASPDTDNLIALAALYGVSLDELVFGKPVDATAQETAKTVDSLAEERKEPADMDEIPPDGTVPDPEEDEIRIHGEDDDDDDDDWDFEEESDDPACNSNARRFFRSFPYPIVTVLLYLVFGFWGICGGWAYGWLVFLTVPLYYTLLEAIFHRNPNEFAYPVFLTLVYLWLGFAYQLWHPMWILFITVPVYYFIASWIRNALRRGSASSSQKSE